MDTEGQIVKKTNHSGGITGGISDGAPILFRAAFKPTLPLPHHRKPSTARERKSKSVLKAAMTHYCARAVVVVESMAALVILDAMLGSMTTRLDKIKDFFDK